jgi:hypothetical protein
MIKSAGAMVTTALWERGPVTGETLELRLLSNGYKPYN